MRKVYDAMVKLRVQWPSLKKAYPYVICESQNTYSFRRVSVDCRLQPGTNSDPGLRFPMEADSIRHRRFFLFFRCFLTSRIKKPAESIRPIICVEWLVRSSMISFVVWRCGLSTGLAFGALLGLRNLNSRQTGATCLQTNLICLHTFA